MEITRMNPNAAKLLALVASVGVTTGCTQVLDTILEVQEGSSVTITLGANDLSSDFVGGIDSTTEIDIGFFDLLFGLPLDGTVTVNDILIAGTAIVIGPGISTGTLCVSPLDPDDPGGGTIEIDLKHRELTLHVSSLTGAVGTDPILGPALGVIEFPVEIDSVTPVSLLDLLGALGGGSLPLDVTQEFDFVIEDGPFAGAMVSGVISLAQVDAFPSDPLLDECLAFLAGP
jgi:hypothetical protein